MKKKLLALALVSSVPFAAPVFAQDAQTAPPPAQQAPDTNTPAPPAAPADSMTPAPSQTPAPSDTMPSTASSDAPRASGGNFQPSQPVGSGNWFINGSVGQAHVAQGPYNDHPTAYALNGGYRWKVGQDLGLGVEIGYNDLGNFKVKNAFNSNDVNLTKKRQALRGWTAGANGKINVWQGLYISGRAGAYGWHGNAYSNDGTFDRHSVNNVNYYAGAGVGYDFSDHFGVGVAYDYYHASKKNGVRLSTDTASVTAEYRF